MLSNFIKSSKLKQKQKVALRSSNSGQGYDDLKQNKRYMTTGISIDTTNTIVDTATNFENNNNFDKNLPHSPLYINTNNNNFDTQLNSILYSPYSSDNYEYYYSSNYNQSSDITSNSSKASSSSTIKYHGSNRSSSYNKRSATYGSTRTIKYSEINQNVNQNDVPISSSLIIKSKNTITSSHPIPSSEKTINNMKGYQSPPPRTVSNIHNLTNDRIQKKNTEASLDVIDNNTFSKIEKSTMEKDDSILSVNTLELYDLYTNAAAYVNSTSTQTAPPKVLDNFRSLNRNFKMNEFTTAVQNSSQIQTSSLKVNNNPMSGNNNLGLMSSVFNNGSQDDSDDSDNEPLFNAYYRNKNRKFTNSSSVSMASLSNSQGSSIYRDSYHGSNSSLSTNLSSSNTTAKSQVKNQVNTMPSGINRRISRSQPNIALPSSSNATKAYTSLLRNYKYSGNKTSVVNTNISGNFNNVQELCSITNTQKPTKKDLQSISVNESPRFTPPLSFTQVNIQDDLTYDTSLPEPQHYQTPIIIGKHKQTPGSNVKIKDNCRNNTNTITPIDTRNNYILPQSNEYQCIKEESKDPLSKDASQFAPISEVKLQQSKPLSPQLKLLLHKSQTPVKNQISPSSPQLATTYEKPLPQSPLLIQKRNSLNSMPIKSIKPLPSPLLIQKHQPLPSPQLAIQSPLQTYITLDNSSISSERNSTKNLASINASTSEDITKTVISQSTSKTKKHDSLTSSPAFANAAIIWDKTGSSISDNLSNSNNTNVFTNMQSKIISNTKISSPKLLSNPFVKKDKESQQQQHFFNYMNYSSSNSSSPVMSYSPIMYSPKLVSSKLNSQVISSPRLSSAMATSPKRNNSILGYNSASLNQISSSNNPILANEKLGRSSHPEMPMNSFNYKSLARTPPITYAASITNSPTLSVHSIQTIPKVSSTIAVSPTSQGEDKQSQINSSTINKRVSSYNIEHQFKEQLQEQIQNGNNSIKSNKYDDLYALPSNSSVSSPSPYLNDNSNTNDGISNVPVNNNISPDFKISVPIIQNQQDSTLSVSKNILESSKNDRNHSTLDRSTHIRHKRNVSFNDDKNQIIKGKDVDEQNNDNNTSSNNMSNENINNQSNNTNSSSNTTLEDEIIISSYSSYPDNITKLTLQVEDNEFTLNNNYISQTKSVKESSNKHPVVGHMKKLSSPSPLLIEKDQKFTRRSECPTDKVNNKLNIENVSYGSNNSSNGSSESDNNGNVQYFNHTLDRGNKKIVDKINLNDDIDGKQFYVKCYKKLNIKELNYLQEVSYKQLKQSYPESSSYIKKDVLKALQQKAKNKNGLAPKWWSYWKKETKNSLSCSVFKTPLNTSILYASVSLDSTDEENPRRIPIIVYKCIQYLKKYGLKKEGIFRVNGNERRIQASVKSFDEPPYLGPDTFENLSVYDIAGLLKLYIRSLPDSLFPNEIYLPLLRYYNSYEGENDRIKILQLFLMMLPRNYLILLEYLFDLFNLVTKFSEYNQMNSSNLAKVFAPNLLKPMNTEPTLKDYEITTSIVKFIIDHDSEFHISRSDNILLKILQEVPDFSNKNYKTKKNNLHIPFMAINNIFSDSEETDDEKSSKYSNSTNGDYILTKNSPQLINDKLKFSPALTSDEKPSNKNMINNMIANNLNVKINKNIKRSSYNVATLPLTPPQSPSSPNQSAVHTNIKSQLNAIISGNDINTVQSTNTNEDLKYFSVHSCNKKEATSFSVLRPNPNPNPNVDVQTTISLSVNNENIVKNGSVKHGRGEVQYNNNKIINGKSSVGNNDNSCSPSSDLSIEHNSSKKLRKNPNNKV